MKAEIMNDTHERQTLGDLKITLGPDCGIGVKEEKEERINQGPHHSAFVSQVKECDLATRGGDSIMWEVERWPEFYSKSIFLKIY